MYSHQMQTLSAQTMVKYLINVLKKASCPVNIWSQKRLLFITDAGWCTHLICSSTANSNCAGININFTYCV